MKRFFALLLALVAALPFLSAPSLAADYTLDEKLVLQLKNGSGLNATASFGITPGARFTAFDEATNALLGALLNGNALNLRYIKTAGTNKGRQELSLSFKKAETEAAWFRYAEDGAFAAFSSSLLGAETYLSAKGDGVIAGLAAGSPSAWPDVLPVLYTLITADNEWSSRAGASLQAYTSRLGIWLQSFTAINTERDAAGQPATRTKIVVPAPAVKAQIKQLLMDFHRDAELASLLKEQLSAREAAAWLEPGMLNAFLSAVDALPLSGDLGVDRLFDNKGALVYSSVSLPMAGFRNIDQVTSTFTAGEGGGETEITVVFLPPEGGSGGAEVSLRYTGGALADGAGASSYSGTLAIFPAEGYGEGFAVEGGDAQAREKTWSFHLYFRSGEESYDPASDRSAREYEATLAVIAGPGGAAAQHLSMKAQLNSGSNSRSATKFTADLSWEDQETGAAMTARIEGSSVPPWAVPALDAPLAIRLDQLSAGQLLLLREQLAAALSRNFAALAAGLLATGQ